MGGAAANLPWLKNCSEQTVSAGYRANIRSTTRRCTADWAKPWPLSGHIATVQANRRARTGRTGAGADRHGHARIRAAHCGGNGAGLAARRAWRFASAGIISTPGVACVVRKDDFSAGVVISASHNPYHDNGVKLFAGSGMKFPDEIEEQLENRYFGESRRFGAGRRLRRLAAESALDEDYLEFLRGLPAIPARNLTGLKIVLDCANGAASSAGPGAVSFARRGRGGDPRSARRSQHQCRLAVRCTPSICRNVWWRSGRRWAWHLTAMPIAPCW